MEIVNFLKILEKKQIKYSNKYCGIKIKQLSTLRLELGEKIID